MTWFAIKSGHRVLRCVQQDTAPEEPHAVISPWVGIPPGGGPGRELHEAGGALYWFNADAAAAWAGIRYTRDSMLAASDWIVTRAIERGEPMPAAWSTYRQALRDITLQPDPFNLSWPVPPA